LKIGEIQVFYKTFGKEYIMKIDGVSAIVVIVIASFAIDRIVTGLLFLLPFIKPWSRAFPDPSTYKDALEYANAVKRQKLIYFIFAGILGGVIVYFGDLRIFYALGFTGDKEGFTGDKGNILNNILNYTITGLILIGGSDRIASVILKSSGTPGAEKVSQSPIQITGRLVLEGEEGKKLS
jgi:hypothetical protein